jgi:hypothetical protein
MYEPTLGRWMEPDPNPAGPYADTMNTYLGFLSNPIRFADAQGMQAETQPSGPGGPTTQPGGSSTGTVARPPVDPGESIPGGPSKWDHLNPLDIRNGFPYAPNTVWFEKRFPNTVAAMKDTFKKAIETYIENQRWPDTASRFDAVRYIPASAFGSVPIGDESVYGDVPQSTYYMSYILGHYTYTLKGHPNNHDVRVVYEGTALKCTNVYSYSATLIVLDELGVSNRNGDLWKIPAEPVFSTQVVTRASWEITGYALAGTTDRRLSHIVIS